MYVDFSLTFFPNSDINYRDFVNFLSTFTLFIIALILWVLVVYYCFQSQFYNYLSVPIFIVTKRLT